MFNILIFILLLSVFNYCNRFEAYRVEEEKESGAGLTLRNFQRIQYKNTGIKDWILIANESYIFPEEDKTIFYSMVFYQYEKGKLSSELKSNWGEINHTTKKLELKGNIFLITPDKKSLKTEHLFYNMETEELTTDSEVELYSMGTYIKGKGLRAKRDLGEYTILYPTAVTRGGKNPFLKDAQ